MNKDRSEEIKEYFGLWMKNDISRDWSLSSEAIDNLKYLIEQDERVQELEYLLDLVRKRKSNLEKQNKRYREEIEKIKDYNRKALKVGRYTENEALLDISLEIRKLEESQ